MGVGVSFFIIAAVQLILNMSYLFRVRACKPVLGGSSCIISPPCLSPSPSLSPSHVRSVRPPSKHTNGPSFER